MSELNPLQQPAARTSSLLQRIPVHLIDPDPFQSRVRDAEEALRELCTSIAQQGLLEPVHLRPSQSDAGRYWVFVGGRRVRAFQSLREQDSQRFSAIPAYVQPDKDDRSALHDSLAENLHRKNLTALEEGQALLRLRELHQWKLRELAEFVGRDYSYVRAIVAKTRIILDSPELLAADRVKPLLTGLLAAVPRERELHAQVAKAWLNCRGTDTQPLIKGIWRLKAGQSLPDPHSPGDTRMERMRRAMRELAVLRDQGFWEAGALTPAELAASLQLEHQLRETLLVVERATRTGEDLPPTEGDTD